MTPSLRGIVLAGGRSSRLGGRHKPALPVGGAPIVARVLAALREAGAEALVVGERDGVPDGVTVVREDPPFAGPLAAVAAGVSAFAPREGQVLLLGGDMPFLAAETLRALAARAGDGVALAAGPDGRTQPLCAAWDESLLRARLAAIGDPVDRPLRVLLEGIDPIVLSAPAHELRDVDTPDDLWAAQSSGS